MTNSRMVAESEKTGPDEAAIARDLRCAPIAKKALAMCLEKRISLKNPPDASELKEVTEGIIEEMTKEDLTVLDVTWVKTLMAQAIGYSMAATYEGEGFETGDERYHGAVYAALEIITGSDVKLGMMDAEAAQEAYRTVGPLIVAKFKELGLNAVEVDHVFDLLSACATNVGENARVSVEFAREKAAEKLFKVPYMEAVKISRIIEIQKNGV